MHYKFKVGLVALLLSVPCLARADKQGEALLRKCVRAMKDLQTLQADFTLDGQFSGRSVHKRGKIIGKKPLFVHYEQTSQGANGVIVVHSDGVHFTYYDGFEKKYTVEKATLDNMVVNVQQELKTFLDPHVLELPVKFYYEPTVGASITIDGVVCRSLVFGSGDDLTKYYVDSKGIVHGYSFKLGSTVAESRLKNLRANQKLPKMVLLWKPPKDAKHTKEL